MDHLDFEILSLNMNIAIGPETVTKWSPNGHQMVTKWSPNGHPLVTKWSRNGPQVVTKWTPGGPTFPQACLKPDWRIQSFQQQRRSDCGGNTVNFVILGEGS